MMINSFNNIRWKLPAEFSLTILMAMTDYTSPSLSLVRRLLVATSQLTFLKDSRQGTTDPVIVA
jgi:hypothetical protein